MKKQLFITLFTFFATTWLTGQTLRQYEKAVDEAFAKKDYYAALYYLDIIQEIDSSIIDLQYKQAEAARNFNAYLLAEKRYQQVIASKKDNEFPQASYWLGHVQKSQGKYQEATQSFRYYLDSVVVKETLLIEAAKEQIVSLEWAQQVKNVYDPDVNIQQLGSEINTPYSEFGPYEKDGKLYFSSLRFPSETNKNEPPKLYSKVLESTNNAPNEIVPLSTDNQDHTAHSAFSKNGDRFFFNVCKYTDGHNINCELYYKDIQSDNTFGNSVRLPNSINIPNSTITQPSIGYNKESKKETLYFATNRPGGKGGMDIWYCDIDEDGQLSDPVNFELVNTEKDEASPFFHSNTRMFYFSSKGRENLGGFDLFQVYIDDGVNWEEVEHVGIPLSTSYDDLYFTLTDYGDEGYFASNREGSIILEKEISACCNDIFKFKLESYPLDLTALTFNTETEGAITDVNVTLYDLSSGSPVEVPFKKLPTGHKHYYKVKSDKEYMLIGQKDHFFPDTVYFNTNEAAPGDRLEERLNLSPLGLNVFVYDIITNDPLSKTSVRLWELDENGNRVKEVALASIEDYQFRLESGKHYRIIADKIGYQPDSVDFNTVIWPGKGPILEKEIYLEEDPPEDIFLPVFQQFPLYFDNDSPDPRTRDTLTEKTYPITYEEYNRRKEIYRQGYSRGLTGENRILAEAEIERFFENEVKASYAKFNDFTHKVLERLRLGKNYTIQVQAYTSPLASSSYNLNLSKRRISSMYNYYRRFNNGEMAKYVDSGAIKFQLKPYGESKAPSSISDSHKNRRQSVFSPAASRERRVVILGVEKSKSTPVMTSSRTESNSISNE